MPVATEKTRDQLIAELGSVEGKAEIIGGEIVLLPMTGFRPSRAATRIVVSLLAFEEQFKRGRAVADGVGFLVDLPHRDSFSPDAAFFIGPDSDMKFIEGAPVFAAEVRSENDYGPAAERAMAEKRADYFAAGTLVVWDVDLQSDEVVSVYRASDPLRAKVYCRGQIAEAEPALPGWTLAVDSLFS